MSRFCPLTGQLLSPVIQNDTLTFISVVTRTSYVSNPEDTLRFTEDLKKSDTVVSSRQLQNITDDNTNPRKIGFCPICKKLAIIVSVQNGNDMETINGCLECKHQFPE